MEERLQEFHGKAIPQSRSNSGHYNRFSSCPQSLSRSQCLRKLNYRSLESSFNQTEGLYVLFYNSVTVAVFIHQGKFYRLLSRGHRQPSIPKTFRQWSKKKKSPCLDSGLLTRSSTGRTGDSLGSKSLSLLGTKVYLSSKELDKKLMLS